MSSSPLTITIVIDDNPEARAMMAQMVAGDSAATRAVLTVMRPVFVSAAREAAIAQWGAQPPLSSST
jgi:hypothetical protein